MGNTLEVSEAEFQRTVCEAAEILGWTTCHTRRSIGGKHKGWVTATTLKGSPDLWMVRGPRLLWVELKAEKGRLTDEQRTVLGLLEQVAQANPHVEVHVWRPSSWPLIERVLR